MKEPLKDAFFQPANHPYFVKEKSFWTIDRAGAQKQPLRTDSGALASDLSCEFYRCESSRAGSISLSLPSGPSSNAQLSTAHDSSSAAAAVVAACSSDECADIAAAAAEAPPDGCRALCAPSAFGEVASFFEERQRGIGDAGVVVHATACPDLCQQQPQASFLTDSLNRKNLLDGYFDADYEDGCSFAEAASGGSRRRRTRRCSDSLRCDSAASGSVGCHGSSVEQPISFSESDRPNHFMATAPSAVLETATLPVAGGRGAASAPSLADGPDVCSICSTSSDGSSSAADVIQPVALKLFLAEEVRDDVTKLASSLTRRLFFARPKQHDDVPAAPTVALYHRDSDRSHLSVLSRGHISEVQRSASVPHCATIGSPLVTRGVPAPRSRDRMRPSVHAAGVMSHRSGHLESSSHRASAASSNAGTQRPSERELPWVTSTSHAVHLGIGLSAEARLSMDSSSSRSSAFVRAAVEQLTVDDSSALSERQERKRRRCRRRCCQAAITCAVLAAVVVVVTVVATLHTLGLLSSGPVSNNSTRAPNTTSAAETTPAPTPSTTSSRTITFIGALRLMMDFLPEMRDINSTVSRNLSRLFCSAVDRIYYNNSESLIYDPLNGCQVTNLTSGSIVFSFILVLGMDTQGILSMDISGLAESLTTKISRAIFEKLVIDYGWSVINITIEQTISTTMMPRTVAANLLPITSPILLPSTLSIPSSTQSSILSSAKPLISTSSTVFAQVGGCRPVAVVNSNVDCRSFSASYSCVGDRQNSTFAQTNHQPVYVECSCPDEFYNATDDSCERVGVCPNPATVDKVDNAAYCKQDCENVYIRCRQIRQCNVFVSLTCCDMGSGNCSYELCSTTFKQHNDDSSINLGCNR